MKFAYFKEQLGVVENPSLRKGEHWLYNIICLTIFLRLRLRDQWIGREDCHFLRSVDRETSEPGRGAWFWGKEWSLGSWWLRDQFCRGHWLCDLSLRQLLRDLWFGRGDWSWVPFLGSLTERLMSLIGKDEFYPLGRGPRGYIFGDSSLGSWTKRPCYGWGDGRCIYDWSMLRHWLIPLVSSALAIGLWLMDVLDDMNLSLWWDWWSPPWEVGERLMDWSRRFIDWSHWLVGLWPRCHWVLAYGCVGWYESFLLMRLVIFPFGSRWETYGLVGEIDLDRERERLVLVISLLGCLWCWRI